MAVYAYGTLLVLLVCVDCVQAYGPYIGCFKEGGQRVMDAASRRDSKNQMTVARCTQHCKNNWQYTFLGVQAGYACFCGDVYDTYGSAPEAHCNSPCPGDRWQMCGGMGNSSVYQVCSWNKWGDNCDKHCGCVGTDVCMRSSGTCVPPCHAGWIGYSCDILDCSRSNDCSHKCNHDANSKWCYCFLGYRLATDHKTCSVQRVWQLPNTIDIDECGEGVHQCSAGDAYCQNSEGSYSCSCPEGYSLQGDKHTCADIDECGEGSHPCSAGKDFCQNSEGSYTCSCPEGYRLRGDKHTCADIDECGEGSHQCSAGKDFCENSEGSYSCSCPKGYRLQNDIRTCSDIDECGEGSHQCSDGVTFCQNSQGTYSCYCPDGYRLRGDKHTCADIDECGEGSHQCSAGKDFCENSEGSYSCSCPTGYRLQNDIRTCADIDECGEGSHQCSDGVTFCQNSQGTYSCYCPDGYRLRGDKHTCADIDECGEGSHQCSVGKDFCENSEGSYSCSCPKGYRLQNDTHTCTDIDECGEGSHQCSEGVTFCQNSQGTYSCYCLDGYRLRGDKHTCADIDECGEGSHQCSDGYDFCHNNEGSYSCSCPERYRLENDTHTCADIDECGEGGHQCSAGDEFCHNSEGGYSCSCPEGYIILDSYACTDIDECGEGSHQCFPDDKFCQNIEGGYSCSCPDGYGLQNDTRTCAESLSTDTPVTVIVVPVILVIIVISLIAVAIVLFRRGVFGRRCTSTDDKRSSLNPPDILNAASVHGIEDETTMSNAEAYASTGITLPPSMKIPLGDLESHIERLSNQNESELQKEFAQILDNKRGSSHVARAPALKDMNKLKNILPYDHNRVVLIGNLTYGASDYINASYIKIKDKIEYIATQGPQKIGTDEFWEMVWQEETRLIVMLTNPVESGKIKCNVYWPEEGMHTCGRIDVTLVREEHMPDFARRTLVIGLEGVEREIRQYHFKSWPDHRVPDSATGILKMLSKVRGERTHGKPTIVHCSAGVGRTGTYIAIDQQLQQAEREGTMDVLACVNELRNSRMNMVQTARQYGFVYTAILEAMSTRHTSTPCTSYVQAGKCKEEVLTNAKRHYKFLESTTGFPHEEQLSAGRAAANIGKNRSEQNIPQNPFRVYLCDDDNDYINAAFVTGVVRTGEFISTQLPLKNTKEDFWRMVFDYKCTTLLILESEETLKGEPSFLPEKAIPYMRHGHYTLKWTDEQRADNHKVLKLELRNLEGHQVAPEEESVYENTTTASQPRKAKTGEPQPLNIQVVKIIGSVTSTFLIDTFTQIQKWQEQGDTSPIVVVCLDGVSKCGLYIATSLLLNTMNAEQEVDVFYATRTIRKYRPEFITSADQYCFLHQTAAEYLDDSVTYYNVNGCDGVVI